MHRYVRRWIFLLILALVFPVLPGTSPVRAQGDIAIEILSVDDSAFPIVRMVITADQAGAPMTDLAVRELEVEEGGVGATPTEVQLATNSNLPLALVIALDVSGSMAEGQTLTRAKSAAISLVNSLSSADVAAVLSFADTVDVQQPFTSDKAALNEAISGLEIDGATALYDAVAESARLAQASGRQRRAVVILTDGRDSGEASQEDRESSLAAAAGASVVFYAVGVGFDTDRSYLEELARRTRGRLFPAFQGADIPAIYTSLAELLRSQLVVTAWSSAARNLEERTVRVRIARGTASGVAERSYASLRSAAAPVQEPVNTSVPIAPIVGGGLAALLLLMLLLRRRRARQALAEGVAGAVNPATSGEPILHFTGIDREPSQARLLVVEGPDSWAGKSFDVGETPVTLGTRPGCAIRLPEAPGIAGEHARLWARDGKVMLHHLARGESRGISGRFVSWTSLAPGDELTVGPYVLRCVSALHANENGQA